MNHLRSIAINLLPRDGHMSLHTGFLAAPVADALLAMLRAGLDWRQETVQVFGRHHPCPRLTAWYGDAGLHYRYAGIDHEAPGWPLPLAELRDHLQAPAPAATSAIKPLQPYR